MEQLNLEFSRVPEIIPKKTGDNTQPIQDGVWRKVHSITSKKKEKYDFSEELIINWWTYTFVISSQIKEWAFTFDTEKGRITNITFRLIGAGKEYRFTVGISGYTITSSEQERYNDNSLMNNIEKKAIGYIQKINTENWWARYVNWEWQAIMNFDYFKYLFDKQPIHQILFPIIKRVILDIENKRSPSQKK